MAKKRAAHAMLPTADYSGFLGAIAFHLANQRFSRHCLLNLATNDILWNRGNCRQRLQFDPSLGSSSEADQRRHDSSGM